MPVETVTPTITTSAYSTGDVVGGKLTVPGVIGQRSLLTHIHVFDDDGEGVQLDFFFFNDELTGTTGYTDNAAFAINASDKSKLIGAVSVASALYIAAGADKTALLTPINLVLERGTSDVENLYVICVIRSTTTFTAATDLRFDFGYIRNFGGSL